MIKRARAVAVAAILSLSLAAGAADTQVPEGVLPVAADGQALNLDFETGTLKDWTAEGDAFKGQPIKGDTVCPRRSDMKSRHQGKYWIGGYEKRRRQADRARSPACRSRSRTRGRSFLVGGGPHDARRASSSCCADTDRSSSAPPATRRRTCARVVVDLQQVPGARRSSSASSTSTPAHWGHINFDDFRFHADKPTFPPSGAEGRAPPPPPDVVQVRRADAGGGRQGDDRARGLQGHALRRRAGRHPADRVLPSTTAAGSGSPRRTPTRDAAGPTEAEARDRILIFEDTDGDGKFDKRTVFIEGLNLVSGIEVGFGGVWVGAAPVPAVHPDNDGRRQARRPAADPARRLGLPGHARDAQHASPGGPTAGSTAATASSRTRSVGKPGTPDKDRMPINAGIWRYHPTRHVFEVFAHGTSNPWGLDFDDHGQAASSRPASSRTCCHIIQGGRYQRQAGQHFNPYTYDDIKTIADHRHYVGAQPARRQRPLRRRRRRPRPLRRS